MLASSINEEYDQKNFAMCTLAKILCFNSRGSICFQFALKQKLSVLIITKRRLKKVSLSEN